MHLIKSQIEQTERFRRMNIINCITGSKPNMLLGTVSESGHSNLGLFSNVIHLGADPAMIGVLFRPQHENPRDSYLNIKSSGVYTLNHVPAPLVENAHYASAKFASEDSEFAACGFTEEYLSDFAAPFVSESPIKIGLKFLQEIRIERNSTILVIGEIQHLLLADELLDDQWQVDLERSNSTAAGGLNTYYGLTKLAKLPYARAKEIPDFGV